MKVTARWMFLCGYVTAHTVSFSTQEDQALQSFEDAERVHQCEKRCVESSTVFLVCPWRRWFLLM